MSFKVKVGKKQVECIEPKIAQRILKINKITKSKEIKKLCKELIELG